MEKNLRILMLEDIPIDAELTEHELSNAKMSCTLKRVATKAKFVKELKQFEPDVILADYTLPQFSGLEALRIVKEARLDVPFILVTGTPKEEVAVQCMKEGADDYILKSSLKRLPGAISNALQKREAELGAKKLMRQVLTIFESITDAFFAVDSEWRLMYLNPSSDSFFSKVHKQREQLWGRNWWDEFPMPADSAGAMRLHKAMAERVAVEFEEYFPSLRSWLYIRAYPADDGLSIYAQDITERKVVENVQRAIYRISEAASAQRGLEQLFGKIHEIVAELVPSRNMFFAFYDPSKDLISFPYFVDEVDDQPEPRTSSSGLTEYVLRTGQPLLATRESIDAMVLRGEITRLGTDCVDWLGVPLRKGADVVGVLAIQSYSEDARLGDVEKNILTYVAEQVAMAVERKRAEEQIRQQANLLEIAQDAIMVLDMSNQITYWNKSAERIYGWTREETEGENATKLLQQRESEGVNFFEQVMETGTWFGELKQTAKDGREVIVESRWSLVRDERGTPASILVIATDVTERKKLEQQFLRAQRLESIGTLASGLAHDLNNVLAPITMAIPLLREKPRDHAEKEILETLECSARRGEGIVKQVLSFVRGIDGDRTILQIKHLVSELRNFLRETFPPSLRVHVKYAKDLWTVTGDATQISQVLMNLAVNARDAMPQGGTLTVEAQNVELNDKASDVHLDAKPGRYVAVTVADSGSGIPAELMHRIFDPFFTTKDPGNGTGLGLFTVLTIMKSHGGFVDVQSEPGKGTQFKIFFPAAEVAETEKSVSAEEITQGNGQVILIVDDEESITELLEALLRAKGYNVLIAKDGTEALAVYTENKDRISVVLLDLLMPYLDGTATIRAMQRIKPGVKIIAMSGLLLDKEKLGDMLTVERIPFLQKPFSIEKLLTTIHELLGDPLLAEAM